MLRELEGRTAFAPEQDEFRRDVHPAPAFLPHDLIRKVCNFLLR
jgi:hypothetical protein